MKIKLLIVFLIGITTIKAQLNPQGKTYRAEISSSCKMMEGGGCMIYNYCILKFGKETVEVSYSNKAVCTPKSREKNYNNQNVNQENKSYNWILEADTIVIKGFEDYGSFKIDGTKLIAKKQLNGNFTNLDFLEEKKTKK